ncbi:MAG TPA: cobaltochelatase subunit CobN [Pyrinomonadaceae bacterium]|nr:cobaltochelatase subunit CobN [Pyrinomonadaceae bacterium]
MKVTLFFVGSSLLAPLREAEREINREHALGLKVAAHNLGAPLDDEAWREAERDLGESELAFVFHVTDGENAARLIELLELHRATLRAVVVINCMPDLMRRTRMGKLSFGVEARDDDVRGARGEGKARGLARGVAAWMGEQVRRTRARRGSRHTQYLKLIERLPALLKLVPPAGRLRDAKHYLQLFCYFLQPTPANVRSMLLYAAKHYAPRPALDRVKVAAPEAMPAVGVYHPDAPALFATYEKFRAWYERRHKRGLGPRLDPTRTVGLLLMRTHVVSGSCAHYDELIRAVERTGLAVVPAISTFMDNRDACERFFVEGSEKETRKARVSQIVSLTGFSFVGGPAMNDSEAAVEFLKGLDVPFRSAVSLDVQTVEAWRDSPTGLNPVQAGMQVAIPEIDGATEPFVFGGMSAQGEAPVALVERCERLARRLRRWNDLRTAEPKDVRLAFVIFCFPPSRGNVGTAAELDVFESLHETFARLKAEGYGVEVPASADELRERILGAGDEDFYGQAARVEYRMSADEYLRLCPYAREIEKEWGAAPGSINTFGDDLLILGARFGNVLVAVQPTFGYEGDPMRLLMARGGAPHHGFAALYTYLEKIFRASAVVHTGTHGALEFMPGKQVGLSGECWPDRLVGELPHVYVYSVNNPSEGSIARRRSYAELVSYLTPPVEDAGLYAGLASLKEEIAAYRQATDERQRARLYEAIEAKAAALHFDESL